MTTTAAIRTRLDLIGAAATTAADALDGNALDLGEGTLATLLAEIDGLAGRLELVCDRLPGCPAFGRARAGKRPRGRRPPGHAPQPALAENACQSYKSVPILARGRTAAAQIHMRPPGRGSSCV
jgi:hypothetical protein